MESTSGNIRYLLWKRNVPQQNWTEKVADWAQCDVSRARALLRGDETPTAEEQRSLATVLEVSEEDFRFADLVQQAASDGVLDIFVENLQFLRKSEGVSQEQLAKEIDVSAATVSRWMKPPRKLRPSNLTKLSVRFGLPSDVDLMTTPIFLDLEPRSDSQRRTWLMYRISELDRGTLDEFFPALRRLLGE